MATALVRLKASKFFMSASVPLSTSRTPTWRPKPWRSCRWVTGSSSAGYHGERLLRPTLCSFMKIPPDNVPSLTAPRPPVQGVEFGGSKLVMRYPDRWIHRTTPSMQRNNSSFSSNTAGTQSSAAATGYEHTHPRAPVGPSEGPLAVSV